MSRIRTYLIRGSAWSLADRVLGVAASLGVHVVLARALSPGHLGGYFVAITVVAVGVTIAKLGFLQPLVRRISTCIDAGREGEARSALRSAVLVVASSLVVVSGLYALGAGRWIAGTLLQDRSLALVSLPVAVWMGISTARVFVAESHRGFYDIRSAVLGGDGLTNAVTAVLALAVWLVSDGIALRSAVLISVTAGAVTLMVSGRRHLHRLGRPDRVGDGARVDAGLLRAGLPLLAAEIVSLVVLHGTMWLVSAARPSEEVALYGAALRISVLVGLPLLALNPVLGPVVAADLSADRRTRSQRLLQASAGAALVAGVVGGVLATGLARPLLHLVFGPFYAGAAELLPILVLGQVVALGVGSAGLVLMMGGEERSFLSTTVIGAASTLVLSWWLLSRYGLAGAAWGATLGLATQNVAMMVAARTRLGVWTFAIPTPRSLQFLTRQL